MAFIYQADIYCDQCGREIMRDLDAEGKAPANPEDETTWDSDDYPKEVPDDDKADSPHHCAEGEDCVNAITLPSGRMMGDICSGLTSDGVEYVRSAIADGGEVAELWAEHFEWDL